MSDHDFENNPYQAPPDFGHEKKPLPPGNTTGCLALTFGVLALFCLMMLVTGTGIPHVSFFNAVFFPFPALGLGLYALRTDERAFGCLGIILSLIPLTMMAFYLFGALLK